MENKFVTLNSYSLHQTKFSEVTLDLSSINNQLYIGLRRVNNPEGVPESNFKTGSKSVLIPFQAWDRLLKEVLPQVNKDLRKHFMKEVVKKDQHNQTYGKFEFSSLNYFFKFEFFFKCNLIFQV